MATSSAGNLGSSTARVPCDRTPIAFPATPSHSGELQVSIYGGFQFFLLTGLTPRLAVIIQLAPPPTRARRRGQGEHAWTSGATTRATRVTQASEAARSRRSASARRARVRAPAVRIAANVRVRETEAQSLASGSALTRSSNNNLPARGPGVRPRPSPKNSLVRGAAERQAHETFAKDREPKRSRRNGAQHERGVAQAVGRARATRSRVLRRYQGMSSLQLPDRHVIVS